MTDDLRALREWLVEKGCSQVAMESTGAYWNPVVNGREGHGLEGLVVNAAHIKAVPGRKTDMNDAQWIADLLRHGLLRGSFIPDRDQREWRELVRYRRSLIEERARELNRLQKVLEGANLKLTAVATDVLGKSGRAILEALIAGEERAEGRADLARGRLKRKRADLVRAVRGLIGPPQRFLLAQHRPHIEAIDTVVDRLDAEIAQRMQPWEAQLAGLEAIPGVGRRGAEAFLAETGVDMSRFPRHRPLAAWAGMGPAHHESAGQRYRGSTRRGSPAIRSMLAEAAHAAAPVTGSYLSAQYRRLAARRGKTRAVLAVGPSILVIAYHLLKPGAPYAALGSTSFDRQAREPLAARAQRRLEALGFDVTIREAA